jgi:hypothetical protein
MYLGTIIIEKEEGQIHPSKKKNTEICMRAEVQSAKNSYNKCGFAGFLFN